MIYSTLYQWGLNVAPGTYTGPITPSGQVWVIRDIRIRNTSSTISTVSGFLYSDSNNVPIFELGALECRPARNYAWTGRQVLEPGAWAQFVTTDTGWSFRVSGYLLS